MAEHVWSVLCYATAIDGSGRVSLLAVSENLELDATVEEVEQMLAPAKKTSAQALLPTYMEFVSWWVRSDYSKPETVTSKVVIITPSGERLEAGQRQINLEGSTGFRTKMIVPAFPFHGLGLYWFVVERKSAEGADAWEPVARSPINIVLAAKPQDVTSATSPEPPSEPTPAAPPESS